MMDGSVTYVDLAATGGRYSFQPTSLHSGGEAEEVKQEQAEREEAAGKGDKARSIHFSHSTPN